MEINNEDLNGLIEVCRDLLINIENAKNFVASNHQIYADRKLQAALTKASTVYRALIDIRGATTDVAKENTQSGATGPSGSSGG